MSVLRIIERGLLAVGLIFCLFYAVALGYRAVGSRVAVRQIESATAAGNSAATQKFVPLDIPQVADHTLWSPKRISGYLDSLKAHFSPPLAVLRMPKVNLEVPVFDGTDELVLNRGVGRITGTALPDQPGNIGIAGHRDGFFRGLKDVVVGDQLLLTTINTTATYIVDRITIVPPSDVSVLAQTQTPAITLVTCYPFYFTGHAPSRYIVRCSLKERKSRQLSN